MQQFKYNNNTQHTSLFDITDDDWQGIKHKVLNVLYRISATFVSSMGAYDKALQNRKDRLG